MKYKNNTGGLSKIGYVAKVDSRDPRAFVYAPPDETNVLGIITEAVPRGKLCEIKTTGTVNVFIAEKTVPGAIIRSKKSEDSFSWGQSKSALTTDAPYFKIGTALKAGSGLIPVDLNLIYVTSSSTGEFQPLDADLTRLATYRRIGGDSHYSEFEADGTLVFKGDAIVWDDSMVAPTAFRSGSTALTFAALTSTIYTHRWDVGDEIHIAVQFPHGMSVNTPIVPHVHIVNKNSIGATGYNVAFDFYYTWANIGSIFPGELSELNVKQSFQNASALTHKMLNFTAITPTGVQGGISSIFLARIVRVAASVEAYNTADIFTLGFDIHYAIDTLGSRQVAIK